MWRLRQLEQQQSGQAVQGSSSTVAFTRSETPSTGVQINSSVSLLREILNYLTVKASGPAKRKNVKGPFLILLVAWNPCKFCLKEKKATQLAEKKKKLQEREKKKEERCKKLEEEKLRKEQNKKERADRKKKDQENPGSKKTRKSHAE